MLSSFTKEHAPSIIDWSAVHSQVCQITDLPFDKNTFYDNSRGWYFYQSANINVQTDLIWAGV